MRWQDILRGAFVLPAGLSAHGTSNGAELPTRLRRPLALVAAADDSLLYVANRASGSISTIDLASGEVVAETDVGKSLVDLAISPDGRYLLALDEAADELVVLARESDGLRIAARGCCRGAAKRAVEP